MFNQQLTKPWLRLGTSVLAAGGLALSALGLAFPAQAAPSPAPTFHYHWCPGDNWNPAWGNNWNWNQCHDWDDGGGPGRLGTAPALGDATTTAAAVGAWDCRRVEPWCERLGILQ